MREDTLLLSPSTLKALSYVDVNTSDKTIEVAIISAQNLQLKQVIGSCLLDKIKDLIDDDSIEDTENASYKSLLDDYIVPFMIYASMEKLIIPLSYKQSNFSGALRTDDEKAYASNYTDVSLIRHYWENERNFYKYELQKYLRNNRSLYPELSCCDTDLYSSNDSGIFLGNQRGKIIPRKCKC